MLDCSVRRPFFVLRLILFIMPEVCTRAYTANQGSGFRNQLNIWCDRLHLGHIQFIADETQFVDENGHKLYQAIPIFPRVVNLSTRYQAQGRSQLEARDLSVSYIRQARLPISTSNIDFNYQLGGHGIVVARPYCLIEYGAYERLTDQYVFGWGTSIRKAEEDAAKKLLTSGRYCFC
ncbi:unnamed protein product [Rhizoctonia solani]|uniref:Uncharacterized protein n=1 Tax=Rhizoctonia solani TaxID=456999 RepID=A0A8H2WLG4_9AGAM|nr:unnamed protein product [Rhizoctonia solani]